MLAFTPTFGFPRRVYSRCTIFSVIVTKQHPPMRSHLSDWYGRADLVDAFAVQLPIGADTNIGLIREAILGQSRAIVQSAAIDPRWRCPPTNGADTAVQNHLCIRGYDRLTVFCSVDILRKDLGRWPTRRVVVPRHVRFAFHAAKDREMAGIADFGLMIWDGASPGTILNALRLVAGGRPCLLSDLARRETATIRSVERWREVFDRCAPVVRAAIRARATVDEWSIAGAGSAAAHP